MACLEGWLSTGGGSEEVFTCEKARELGLDVPLLLSEAGRLTEVSESNDGHGA